MTAYRIQIREIYDINGNSSEDFFASCFYPACVVQMDLTTVGLNSDGNPVEDIDMREKEGVENAAYTGENKA